MKLLPFPPRKDQVALSEVVHQALLVNLEALYSTALRLTGNPTQAEDIVQETARKALQAAETIENTRNVRAWLFRILVNSIRDHLRRSRKWDGIELLSDDLHGGEHPFPSLQSTQQDVRAALNELPSAMRMVVLLIDIEGFTLVETAAMLHVPVGTVASRLARAHRQLRMLLHVYQPDIHKDRRQI